MSFTTLELRALHRDLSKWIRSIERHLAAESGEDAPHLSNDSGPLLAELSILIRPFEAEMLLRIAGEVEGIEGGQLHRLKAALRYCLHFTFREAFGEAPTQVETTGATLGTTQVSGELPP